MVRQHLWYQAGWCLRQMPHLHFASMLCFWLTSPMRRQSHTFLHTSSPTHFADYFASAPCAHTIGPTAPATPPAPLPPSPPPRPSPPTPPSLPPPAVGKGDLSCVVTGYDGQSLTGSTMTMSDFHVNASSTKGQCGVIGDLDDVSVTGTLTQHIIV